MSSGNALSPEIWLMILEQLYQSSPNISQLRLVSRNLNGIAIPFCYRKARLNPVFFEKEQPDARLTPVWKYIQLYATYLIIDRELYHWDRVALLLKYCQRLKDVECTVFSWTSSDEGSDDNPCAFVSLAEELRAVLKYHHHNVRIHCDFSVIPQLSGTSIFLNLRTENLVTLKLLHNQYFTSGGQRIRIENWAKTVVASPKLEVLHIRFNRSHLFRYLSAHNGGKKFPPIRELLVDTHWKYPAAAFSRSWDFSKLSVLILRHTDMDDFVESVPLEQLSGLTQFEYLHKENFSSRDQRYWTDHFINIICNIRRLEELAIECYDVLKLLPALEKHRSSLRALRLRDVNRNGFGETFDGVESLAALSSHVEVLGSNVIEPSA